MRRTRGTIAVAVAIIGVAGCGGGSAPTAVSQSPKSALAATADRVQTEVAKVWPNTDRIWPGVDFGGRSLLLTDGTEGWAISTGGSTPVKVAVPQAGVAVRTWHGRDAVVVSSQVADPFLAGTDAMFRAAKLPAVTAVARDYPLETAPRLDRAMLYDSLVEAYRTPADRSSDLAAAAYWNDRWTQDSPGEAARSRLSDRVEGTDGYFDGVVSSMGAADRVDYPSEVNAGGRLVGGVTPVGVVRDQGLGEGRGVNAVAAMNLDATHPGWKDAVWAGSATPVSVLLGGVSAAPQQVPSGLVRAVNDEVARENSALIPRLDPLIAAYRDREPMVLIPAAPSAAQYVSPQVPYPLVDGVEGRFVTKTGSATAQRGTALTGVVGGIRYLMVPVSSDNVSHDQVSLDVDGFKGNFQVRPVVGADGRKELIAV
jgi:hypothetical protein